MGKSKTTDCSNCGTRNCTKASAEQTNKWKESPQETAKKVSTKKKGRQ